MTKPSWQDFATHDESIVPELWDGVVGAWAPCLGPTGSRLHDMSRRSNWGTLTNMDPATDWVVSDGQYAMDFDGSDDYVALTSHSPLPTGDFEMTLSIWVKMKNSTGLQTLFSCGSQSGVATSYGIFLNLQGTDVISLELQDNFVSNGLTVLPNVLYHIVIIKKPGGLRETTQIFVNNVTATNLSNSSNVVPNLGNSRAQIGTWRTRYEYFAGMLFYDLSIWNRALSAGEVSQLYQLGRGGMYQRRRRSRIYIPQAGFQAAWARRQSQIIGGGL